MKIDVDEAINTIVEAMLPRFSPQNKGLLIELNATYFYGKKNEDNYLKIINLFFHRPSNYTRVFYLTQNRIEGFPDLTFSPILNQQHAKLFSDKWYLESDHDSCWRYGVGRILDKLEKEVVENTPLNYPIEYNKTYINFGFNSPKIRAVEVKRTGAYSHDPKAYSVLFI